MYCSDAFRYTRFSRCIFTLSGEVRNSFTGPVEDATIEYFVNGEFFAITTDVNGRYFIRVREGDHVRIVPSFGLGVTVCPERYVLCCVCSDRFDLDFIVNPVVPDMVRISGALIAASPLIANATVNYTANGVAGSTLSDATGAYFIDVPLGANVSITAPTIPGFSAVPPNYDLMNVMVNTTGQDFTYTAVI